MRAFSLRSFWLPVLLTTLVAAFFGALLAHRGRDWDRLLAQKATLEGQLGEMEQENARLKAQRDQLLSSPEAIERVAREDYGFVKPGEKMQLVRPIRPAKATSRPAAPPSSLPWLSWSRIPVLLPLAVFVATALVFAVLNVLSTGNAEGAREPAQGAAGDDTQ